MSDVLDTDANALMHDTYDHDHALHCQAALVQENSVESLANMA